MHAYVDKCGSENYMNRKKAPKDIHNEQRKTIAQQETATAGKTDSGGSVSDECGRYGRPISSSGVDEQIPVSTEFYFARSE